MLADHLLSLHKGFLGQDAIGLERHFNGLLEVGPGFFEGFPLSIGSRQFLNESDVAFRDLSALNSTIDSRNSGSPDTR